MKYARLLKPALLSLFLILSGRGTAAARDREEDSLSDQSEQLIIDLGSLGRAAPAGDGLSDRGDPEPTGPGGNKRGRSPAEDSQDAADPEQTGNGAAGDEKDKDADSRAAEVEADPQAEPDTEIIPGKISKAEAERQKRLDDAALLERELARSPFGPEDKSGCFFSLAAFSGSAAAFSYGAAQYLF